MSISPPERNKTPSSEVPDIALDTAALWPEERRYLEEHSLRKPMGTIHIWSLGVGAVITGEYFGWNGGLGVAGPIGMLVASLFVCVLYMAWVLSLSELSVAMPYAGGPLAYGRRAVGPWLGFVMGWSMFLECLFAAIGTAIATGAYIYFILSLLFPEAPKAEVTTLAALVTVALFGLLQWIGAKEQAKVMEWMTYGAILALVWFWIACIPGVKLERIVTTPLLTDGWTGVLKAIDKLKPGALPQDLFETMVQGVRAAGIPNYSNFFVGHTIGLEAREFPFILGPEEEVHDPFLPNTTNIPMERGMVVNLEASSHEMGWGSVQVEYTLAVTENGHEHLIRPEQKLFSLPLQ